MIVSAMEPANQLNERITSLYDFSAFSKIVEVGGGHGELITSILKANPQAFGVLLDAEQAISDALPKLDAAGVADRCATIAGDFSQSVPAGGDVYIVHDRDDETTTRILTKIRNQILKNGRVIIVETGGKERTAKEFDQLLSGAGFRFLRVIPTDLPTRIVEAEPA